MVEFLDIVNEFDQVIGVTEKSEIYRNKHTHRVIHVLLFDISGRLALQLRGKDEKFLPGYWFASVAGHVRSGETYRQGARREMKEELSIKTPLKYLGKQLYSGEHDCGMYKFQSVFEARYDGEVCFDKTEVERVAYFYMQEIKQMILAGENFHPELLFLLHSYYNL